MCILSFLLSIVLTILPAWQKGNLDIHFIATGSGESSLIVMPDGTTVLVDAGQMKVPSVREGMNSAQIIAEYIGKFAPMKDKVDYFYLTHLHSDHMNAVVDLSKLIHIGKIVDRDYPNYNFPSDQYIQNRCNREFINTYIEWVRGREGERFQVGRHNQIAMLRAPRADFDIWNLAGGGYISNNDGSQVFAFSNEDMNLFDENMMSCAFLLRYGPFSYYCGGDLSGSNFWIRKFDNGQPITEQMKANRNVSFREFEPMVADLTGPVTVAKLSHHGCPDATTPYMLWKMRPEVMCVCASDDKHPSPTTLRRILDPMYPSAHAVFATTEVARKANGEELWQQAMKPAGHIVIRVIEGGKSYQVFVLDAKDGRYELIYASEPVVLAE